MDIITRHNLSSIKKNLKLGLALTILLICFNTKITYSQSTDSIAMFRGNPQHTGYYGNQNAIKVPKVKWMYKTGGMIFSSPVIYDGVVFFGSNDSCLYAVDETKGELKWKFKTKGEIKSAPLVYKAIVYFISMDGYFYALNSKNGSIIWKFQTEGERLFTKLGLDSYKSDQLRKDYFDYLFLSSAVTDGKTLYFGCGDGNLYALDIQNGNKLWSFKTADVIHSSPALYKGIIYFGSMDHYFYAVDGKTGNLVWKYSTGTDTYYWNMTGILSSASVQNDIIYFGCRDAHLYAFTTDGTTKWAYSTGGTWVLTSPALYNGNVYFGTSDPSSFNSVSAGNGKINFSKGFPNYIYSSPAVCDSVTYLGCYNGTFFARDTKTGDIKWTFKTEGNKRDSLHVLSKTGAVIIKIDDTNDSTKFASILKLLSAGAVISSPLVNNGDVYFGSADGYLYALTEGKVSGIDENKNRTFNYRLFQNYPNPFNPETVISYQLPVISHVELKVYDTLGREVAALIDKEQNPGNYEVIFDGSSLASGIYLYKISAGTFGKSGNFIDTHKMLLMK